MNTINKISDRLKGELELLENENKHYETSFYGPHNSLLFHYFPFDHGFIIKPQQRLRAQVVKAGLLQPPDMNNPDPDSDPDPDHSNCSSQSNQSDDSGYSLDSNGQHVTAGDGDLLPDFGVSVCNSPGQHSPFLLWEIKRDNSRTKGSLQQMRCYVDWLCNYHASLMLKGVKEPEPVYAALIERGTIRITPVIQGEKRDAIKFSSILDPRLDVWLRELSERMHVLEV